MPFFQVLNNLGRVMTVHAARACSRTSNVSGNRKDITTGFLDIGWDSCYGGGILLRDVSSSTARVWEASSGRPVGESLRHDDEVRTASFSPDGRWVVTASLERLPADARLCARAAEILKSLGDRPRALAAAEKALALDPRYSSALAVQAWARTEPAGRVPVTAAARP